MHAPVALGVQLHVHHMITLLALSIGKNSEGRGPTPEFRNTL